ncbi:STAS domain-containing protein [Streptomyces sp. NPDC090106]|uniref:STAS domain-containing protein n=1 Tax=Streptomyces sp. NPDC090106 TaxID=3365946 RepID=UPI0038027327
MSRWEAAHEAVVVRSRAVGSVWVITLQGDFDFESNNAVDEAVAQALCTVTWPIVFDVTGVSFCDSQLLGSLLRAAGARRVGLVGANSLVRRLTEVTGTDHLLVAHPDLDSARAALTAEPESD